MEKVEELPAPEPPQTPGPVEVMSEVHLGCPPNLRGSFISHFSFPLPPETKLIGGVCDDTIRKHELNSLQHTVDVDEDGDLIVARRTKQTHHFGSVTIQHNIISTIQTVGLQVWRAELILADYVLHKMFSSHEYDDVVAVELGAGTGLVGMLIARAAKAVYITDLGVEVLDNCAKNVQLNSGIFGSQCSVKVRELDWMKPWPTMESTSGEMYSWTSCEVEDINKASVLLAADVIYSDELTDAFFHVLEKLMCRGSDKVLYLALEKRYNFSLVDLDVVANGYSHFRSYLRDEECRDIKTSFRGFVGKCIELDVPQYVREYERGNDVELWEIKYVNMRPK